MTQTVVHFSGQVQGVGFRATTFRIAQSYSVAGYVQNLPDGRVKAVIEGSNSEIEKFVSEVCERMEDYVRDVSTDKFGAIAGFDKFEIRY